jgi:hypothetical protein
LANESADPYAIAYHSDDCPETVWDDLADGDERQLIGQEELEARDCRACWHRWELIQEIIEICGDADYYDIAAQAFDDLSYVERFHPDLGELDALRWEFAQAVDAEIQRLRRQKEQQRAAEQKVASSQ